MWSCEALRLGLLSRRTLSCQHRRHKTPEALQFLAAAQISGARSWFIELLSLCQVSPLEGRSTFPSQDSGIYCCFEEEQLVTLRYLAEATRGKLPVRGGGASEREERAPWGYSQTPSAQFCMTGSVWPRIFSTILGWTLFQWENEEFKQFSGQQICPKEQFLYLSVFSEKRENEWDTEYSLICFLSLIAGLSKCYKEKKKLEQAVLAFYKVRASQSIYKLASMTSWKEKSSTFNGCLILIRSNVLFYHRKIKTK